MLRLPQLDAAQRAAEAELAVNEDGKKLISLVRERVPYSVANQIGDAGAAALSEALKSNATLTTL